jgi:hypothetical protein
VSDFRGLPRSFFFRILRVLSQVLKVNVSTRDVVPEVSQEVTNMEEKKKTWALKEVVQSVLILYTVLGRVCGYDTDSMCVYVTDLIS